MLYFGTSPITVTQFENNLSSRYNLEKLGQAHWYLSTCIVQHATYDIILDQTKFCSYIIQRYLSSAGCKNVVALRTSPLPTNLTPSTNDLSPTDEDALTLSQE